MSDVTKDGERLIDNWRDAQKQLQTAQRDVTRAECELSNATSALAKWLMPKDAKPGEVFSVWHGDSLIQVTVPHPGHTEAKLEVRSRGRSMA